MLPTRRPTLVPPARTLPPSLYRGCSLAGAGSAHLECCPPAAQRLSPRLAPYLLLCTAAAPSLARALHILNAAHPPPNACPPGSHPTSSSVPRLLPRWRGLCTS